MPAYFTRVRLDQYRPQLPSGIASVFNSAGFSVDASQLYRPVGPSYDAVSASTLPSAASAILGELPCLALWSLVNPSDSGKVATVSSIRVFPAQPSIPVESSGWNCPNPLGLYAVSGVSGGVPVPVIALDSSAPLPPGIALLNEASATLGGCYMKTSSAPLAAGSSRMGLDSGWALAPLAGHRNSAAIGHRGGGTHPGLYTVRPGEAIGVLPFPSTYPDGPHFYELALNFSAGTRAYAAFVSLAGLNNAPLVLMNDSESGVVVTVTSVGIVQTGPAGGGAGATQYPQHPIFALSRIEGSQSGNVVDEVHADSADPASGMDVRSSALVISQGVSLGAVLTKPLWHTGDPLFGHGPYQGSAGASILAYPRPIDVLGSNGIAGIRLQPGQGLAVSQRGYSGYGIEDLVAQYSVNPLPSRGNIICVME